IVHDNFSNSGNFEEAIGGQRDSKHSRVEGTEDGPLKETAHDCSSFISARAFLHATHDELRSLDLIPRPGRRTGERGEHLANASIRTGEYGLRPSGNPH